MVRTDSGDRATAHPRLPRWKSVPVARSHGRQKSDWALIVPVPASIGANKDVLFSHFGDTVSLVHCLQGRLTAGNADGNAVIAVAESLVTEVKALLAADGIRVSVESVTGQASFDKCIAAGLARLNRATQYVLVHDILRPLASDDLSDRILDRLRQGHRVVVPALGLVDSVKTIDVAGVVTQTVDRSLLRSAQFPRGFHRAHLTALLEAAGGVRGDLDALTLTGTSQELPTVIEGDPDAFALDIPRDIGLADAIYHCRLADQR